MNKTYKASKWLLFLLFCFIILLIVFHSFFFLFKISSISMEPTLFDNEFVLSKKIRKDAKNIGRFDIVFFSQDENSKPHTFVKRCLGLPGDTIFSYYGNYIINSKDTFQTISYLLIYINNNKDEYLFRKNFTDLNLYTCIYDSTGKHYVVPYSKMLVDELNIKFSNNHKVKFVLEKKNNTESKKIIVPKCSLRIALNDSTDIFYLDAIRKHELVDLIKVNNQFFINGVRSREYRFKNNYFFVIGDNMKYSEDSRYMGFIPETHLIGKAICVLNPIEPYKYGLKKIRWNKMFHRIK